MLDAVFGRVLAFVPTRAHLPIKILSISALVFFILVTTRPDIAPREPVEKAWAVFTQIVTLSSATPTLHAYGEIVTARRVDLRALVGGEVVSVSPRLEEGAFVKKGETLLTIDPFDYENALAEAQAQRLGAEATYLTAQTDFERAEKLLEKGTVARKYLDDRRADYLMQKGNYDRLKILVRRATRNLANTNVIAPFDAYVGNINAREGRLVNLNDYVATLTDSRNYELRFNLSDAEYGALLSAKIQIVGQPITATWKIGNRTLSFAGKVRRVGAVIDQTTRGVNVYADIINPDSTVLRSGAFVSVALQTSEINNVVKLPEAVLSGRGGAGARGKNMLFVVQNNRLVAREVDVLLRSNNEIYISAGLKGGEEVLLMWFNQAATGVLVQTENRAISPAIINE